MQLAKLTARKVGIRNRQMIRKLSAEHRSSRIIVEIAQCRQRQGQIRLERFLEIVQRNQETRFNRLQRRQRPLSRLESAI